MRTLSLIIILLTTAIYTNAQEIYDAEYFGYLGELKWSVKYTSDSLTLIKYDKNIQGTPPYYHLAKIFISKYSKGDVVVDIIFIGDSLDYIQYVLTEFVVGNSSEWPNTELYSAVVVDASAIEWKVDNRGTLFQITSRDDDSIQSLMVWRLVHRYKYRFDHLVLEEETAFTRDELNAEIAIAMSLAKIQIASSKKHLSQNQPPTD